MKAVVMSAVGGPEVLRVEERPLPVPRRDEVLVRVMAAGINPIDYKVRKTGALGFSAGRVMGFDAAGVVENVGADVTAFKPGDRVFFSSYPNGGTYAEYVAGPVDLAVAIPAGLTFEQAAALPLAGITAYDSLFTRGRLTVGETILIAAANGGVGSLALQLAKAAGTFVIATCSARSREFVRSIPVCGPAGAQNGPDRLLDYTSENWSEIIKTEFPDGLDLVFDCAGHDVVSRAMPLMRTNGRIVTIVNPSGKLDEGYRKNIDLLYHAVRIHGETLQKIAALVERKLIVPLVDSVLPLEDAAEGHRRLEAGGVKGKILLSTGVV